MAKAVAGTPGVADNPSGLKKWSMRQYWRLQQSQSIISMGFWVILLTLNIWPYIRWRFEGDETLLGIPATYWGFVSISAVVILFVMFVGWFYDHFLTLWKEHQNVILERNPFATYLLTPRDALIIGHLVTILRTQHPEDKEIQAQCDWMEKWIASIPELEVFRRMVTELDAKLDEQVPEFNFLPHGAVEGARQAAKKDKMKPIEE